jgi:hypothetical protein
MTVFLVGSGTSPPSPPGSEHNQSVNLLPYLSFTFPLLILADGREGVGPESIE